VIMKIESDLGADIKIGVLSIINLSLVILNFRWENRCLYNSSQSYPPSVSDKDTLIIEVLHRSGRQA
jgi:hypothetical protein